MPDIPNRSDREAQVETLLRRAIGRSRQELIDALGSPPNVSNIPDRVWEQIRQDVADDTRRVIAVMLLLSIRRMNDQIGEFTIPPADAARRAADYAERRSATLADSVVSTYRDRLRTAVTEAKNRIDAGESRSTVERELRQRAREIGVEQAVNGGVTETTAANTAGELFYRDEFESELGIELIGTWHTEGDGHVCELCSPLDETTNDEWEQEYPMGPPQPHPQCRCWITWQAAETLEEVEA